MKKIFNRVHEAMGILALQPRDLCYRLGYQQSAVSKILNGKSKMTPQFVKLFCLAFGISEQWITQGVGEIRSSCHAEDIPLLDAGQREVWDFLNTLSAEQVKTALVELEKIGKGG